MIRSFPISLLMLASWTALVHSQSPPANPIGNLVYVQSANFEDMKAWADKISRNASALKIDPFKTVLAQHNDVQNGTYEDLRVDVVMYDPFRIGTRILIKPNPMTADDYIQYWNGKVTGDRILFFFQKPSRDAGDYNLKRLKASPELENKQLPDFITRYIEKNILTKTKTSEETLKAGINALKNAFDQQFKERLRTDVPDKLLNPVPDELKPGRANYSFSYIYFQPYEENYEIYFKRTDSTSVERHINLTDTIYFPFMLSLSEKATTINIFNETGAYRIFREGNPDTYISCYDSTIKIKIIDNYINFNKYLYNCEPIDFPYKQDKLNQKYFITENGKYFKDEAEILNEMKSLQAFSPEDIEITHNRIVEIDKNCKHFQDIRKYQKERVSSIVFNEHQRNFFCKVRVGFGSVKKGEEIGYLQGQMRFSDFTNNRPTWCNAFAIRASEIIFGNSPITGTTATIEPYMQKNSSFINVLKNDNWQNKVLKYILSGYIVYFIHASDHIEIGYPFVSEKVKTIGGGSIVDIKLITAPIIKDFIEKRASIYIYVGHLDKEL